MSHFGQSTETTPKLNVIRKNASNKTRFVSRIVSFDDRKPYLGGRAFEISRWPLFCLCRTIRVFMNRSMYFLILYKKEIYCQIYHAKNKQE